MKKKLLSLILAGSVVASMAAIATTSASAILNSDGTYTPGEGVKTYRAYFVMPDTWKNKLTDTAGCYWWDGTDHATSIAGEKGVVEWPGYKANRDKSLDDKGVNSLFYVDIPTDVTTVVWNNYIDGGLDEKAEAYSLAAQGENAQFEDITDGDFDLYDLQEDFWSEMEDSYNGDKAALGSFADNFQYGDYGFSFNHNNLIWVPDLNPENFGESETGMSTCSGDWYFYYGDGTYGSYPTKEEAQQKGKVGDLTVPIATPDETPNDQNKDQQSTKPTPGAPSKDANSSVGKTATTDSTSTADNTSIKTGATSLAVILFVVLSGVATVAYFTRKKYDE